MKQISLLGASGSIGVQTLDVLKQHPDRFQLVAFSVGINVKAAISIIEEFKPKVVSVKRKEDCDALKNQYSTRSIRFVYGEEGLIDVATYKDADIVLNAVMGSVGLVPTLHAIESKKIIALANKETLVTAGHIVMAAAKRHGATILPVDSEHSAIFQCLQGEKEKNIQSLILTASGGSFRDKSRNQHAS